jgi:hypothetical protein
MKTLELRLQVTAEGKLVLPPVPEIKPGEYDAVLVIGQVTALQSDRPPLNLPVIDVGEWPEGSSLRREDLIWRRAAGRIDRRLVDRRVSRIV